MTDTSQQYGNYTVRDYSGQALSELEEIWRRLECGTDMTAFQSYDWQKNLWLTYRRERCRNLVRKLRYILVSDGQTPVLIAPLEIRSFGLGYKSYGAARGVYFVGRRGYTDYLNFVYETLVPEALEALLDYVRKTYRQKRFYFDRMLETTASYRFLTQRYACETNPVHCAALVLPETFEAYQATLSKSTRQNIRTAINRAKRNEIPLTHRLIHDENEQVKEELLTLNRQRLRKKNQAARKQMSFAGKIYCSISAVWDKLFSAKLDVVHESKHTFSFLVLDGDKLVSFFWGIRNVHQQEYYVILVGVREDYEWYSPNISHLYLYLQEYYQQTDGAIRIIDFTRGAEGYKKTIGCTARPVSNCYFTK